MTDFPSDNCKWFLFKLKLKPWIFCVETWASRFSSRLAFNTKLSPPSDDSDVGKLFSCFSMLKHFRRLNSPSSSFPSSSNSSRFFLHFSLRKIVLYFNDVAPHNDKDVFFHNLLQFEFPHADAFTNDDVEWLSDEAYKQRSWFFLIFHVAMDASQV